MCGPTEPAKKELFAPRPVSNLARSVDILGPNEVEAVMAGFHKHLPGGLGSLVAVVDVPAERGALSPLPGSGPALWSLGGRSRPLVARLLAPDPMGISRGLI